MMASNISENSSSFPKLPLKTQIPVPYQKGTDLDTTRPSSDPFKEKKTGDYFDKLDLGLNDPTAKILALFADPLDFAILDSLPGPLTFDILKACDRTSAFSILNLLKVDLMLLDIDHPEIDRGFEFCRQLKSQEKTEPVPIIFISEKFSLEQKSKGLEAGGTDFVFKPLHPDELLSKVRTHLEIKQLQSKFEARILERTAQLSRMTDGFRQNSERLERSLKGIIKTMALTVETRDPYTVGHQRRVAELSRAIAREMGLPQKMIDGLYAAAKIHDLGKITVPAEILTKPEKLSAAEFGLVKLHPEAGYTILEDIDFPWPVARMVLEHHERINGSGYPNKLTGEDLLIESRILAVADVVEAITFFRPYRIPFGIDMALFEIEKEKGRLYEAEVADFCLDLFRKKKFVWN